MGRKSKADTTNDIGEDIDAVSNTDNGDAPVTMPEVTTAASKDERMMLLY